MKTTLKETNKVFTPLNLTIEIEIPEELDFLNQVFAFAQNKYFPDSPGYNFLSNLQTLITKKIATL